MNRREELIKLVNEWYFYYEENTKNNYNLIEQSKKSIIISQRYDEYYKKIDGVIQKDGSKLEMTQSDIKRLIEELRVQMTIYVDASGTQFVNEELIKVESIIEGFNKSLEVI